MSVDTIINKYCFALAGPGETNVGTKVGIVDCESSVGGNSHDRSGLHIGGGGHGPQAHAYPVRDAGLAAGCG